MKPLGVGIVGCGFFGRQFANLVNEVDGMRTVAVYGGRNAQATAEETGSELAGSLEELIAHDRVEAIVIASPNHLHKEPALLAAAKGKHIFCEKPVSLALEDSRAMLAASRAAGVIFMAGHVLRLMAGIRRARQRIEQGAIGTPIVCHAERTGWEAPGAEESWKKDTARSGGHLFHHIHELDLLLAIMGPAEAVFTAGGRLAHPQGQQDDVLLLTLFFSGGRLGTMQYGSGFRAGEHYVKINGTEGYVLMDFKRSLVTISNASGIEEFGCCDCAEEDAERVSLYQKMDGGIIHGDPAIRPPRFLSNLMRLEMEKFRDAVQAGHVPSGLEPLFDGTAAYESISAASAAMQSLRESRVVQVELKERGV